LVCAVGCSGILLGASVIILYWIDLKDLLVKFFACWQRDWM